MKRLLLLVAVILCAVMATAGAQVPIVQVYLDEDLSVIHSHGECPPFGTLDTLYVVASGFEQSLVNVAYSVDTHANFSFLLEEFPSGFAGAGLTAIGVLVSFGGPQSASGKLVVERIIGYWSCACGGLRFPYVTVGPHADFGKIQATRWPDLASVEAAGGFNSLCAVLPVQPSTWGSVKALYR